MTPGSGAREVRGLVPMTLLGTDVELTRFTAELCWRSDDPWAVTVRFGGGDDAQVWLMGLDLLVAGCVVPAGLGDVSLLPVPDLAGAGVPVAAELLLSSPDGHACFRLRIADLDEVLDRVLRARDLAECATPPPDVDGIDGVDGEFARLLASQRAAGGEGR